MVLIQMLLPTSGSAVVGAPDPTAALVETRRELAEKFEGLTAWFDRRGVPRVARSCPESVGKV